MLTSSNPGSSPRGRGKLFDALSRACGVRLIPARAGKTTSLRATLRVIAAHPRAGGENATADSGTPGAAGSSPRGRGKPNCDARLFGVSRLIPARAGKTPVSSAIPGLWKAHPRAGGENFSATVSARSPAGSSPHGRGKRARRV